MSKRITDLGKGSYNLAQRLYVWAEPVVRPKLELFWKYAKVEMRPPSLRELPEIRSKIESIIRNARNGNWREVTVQEAWLNALVTTEVVCWFFVGEVIGKRHIVGYLV